MDQPEVSLLLSGMSDEKQLEENLLFADRSSIGMVSEEERGMYQKAKEIFDSWRLLAVPAAATAFHVHLVLRSRRSSPIII